MKTNGLVLSVIGLFAAATVLIAGCAPGPSVSLAQGNPADTVCTFYDWYVGFEGSPLADNAYRTSEQLSDKFVDQVDQTIASFDRGGADPFRCAQDKPGDLSVGEAVVSGDTAVVPVTQIWNPDTEYETTTSVTVELEQIDGQWLISGIKCQ